MSSFPSESLHSGRETSMPPPTFNIVLFGETGVGKSSVINQLAKRQVARTSPDAQGCTMKSDRYTLDIYRRRFNIWDTVGMGEPEFSADGYVNAVQKTFELTQQLLKEGGIDLLLLCIPGGRITATVAGNYKLFYEVLCDKKVPIALVVTHLENEEVMESWWNRNEDYIVKTCGLRFNGHACVATRPNDPKADESRAAMEKLLLSYDTNGRYKMPSDWFQRFIKSFIHLMPRSKDVVQRKKKLERTLRDNCRLNPTNARLLAEDLTIFRPAP